MRPETIVQLGTAAAKGVLPSLERDIDRAGRGVERAAQSQSIIAGVVISAALLIGVFVVAQIAEALPNSVFVDASGNTTDFGTAKNDTIARIGDAVLIGAVVVIVLFAAIILRVLRSL